MRAVFAGLFLATVVSVPALAAETITYTYDAFGRVVTVNHSGTVNNAVTTTYTNDKVDNRTKVKTTGAV